MTGIIGNPGIKTKNPNTEMIKMTGDIHQRKEKHLITGALAEIKTETKAEAISHKDLLDMIVETKNIKGEIQVIMVELTKKILIGEAYLTKLLIEIKIGTNLQGTQIASGAVDHICQAVAKNMIFILGHLVLNVTIYIQLIVTKAIEKRVLIKRGETNIQ